MANSKTGHVPTGLLPDLYKRLLDTLVAHPQFESNEKLRAVFIDARIHPWRNTLPQADDVDTRVRRTIDYLYERHNAEGKNALVLLLQVLSECVDPGDALCGELSALADEVEKCLHSEQSTLSLYYIPETILIPAGEFWMGSNDDDPDANPNEMPRHKLSLPAYKIDKYPVTNAQYRQFVREAGHHPPAHWTDGEIPPGKDAHPIVCVSSIDAQAYCNWLSRKTGVTYRLPSEQEWEKAARGPFPDDRRYPWGNGWYKDYCNTNETGSSDTMPVTAFESINKSPFGVVDMAGNVWEWTSSVYTRYGTTVTSLGSFAGLKYTVRGGAYTIEARSARISCRGRYGPHEYKPYLGFRVVINIG